MALSRKKKKKIKRMIVLGGFFTLLAAGAVVLALLFISAFYSSHFFKNSTINSVDVGKMSVSAAQNALSDYVKGCEITIIAREGTYTIPCRQIDYNYDPRGEIKALINSQENTHFARENKLKHTYTTDLPATYDGALLKSTLESLPCCDTSKMRAPEDAYIEKREDEGYMLVPEDNGTTLIFDKAFYEVKTALSSGSLAITLSDNCYVNAAINTSDPELTRIMQNVTAYYDTTITYHIGDATEVVDSPTIRTWLTLDENFDIYIDEDKITKFVQSLASTYNTYSDKREFKTSMGDTVVIGGGDYGWVINKSAEKQQLLNDLQTGGSIDRTPVFEQTAKDYWPNDIGDTYVEIDYTNQHMWYYREGSLVLESDIVSGCLNNGTGSPDGVFKIVYKDTDVTLVGEDYASDVKYFMPFAYNVGFHDASWREEFGGERYRTSGSHGCVNMPTDMAKMLFDEIEIGTPVVAFYRESVVISTNNAAKSNAFSYVAPPEPEGEDGTVSQ